MTKIELSAAALLLPADERLALAEELWLSVEANPASLPLYDWQKAILDERLEAARRDPDSWLDHEEMMRRVNELRRLNRQSDADGR